MSKRADFLYASPGFLIRRLQQVAISYFVQSLADYGLTPIQYTILRVIEAYPGADQATIAGLAVLDKSTVKDVLTRLESRGLIDRRRDAQDRRATVVTIASAGQQLLGEVEPAVEHSRGRLLAPLLDEERAQFLGAIETLLRAHEADHGEEKRKPWRRLGDRSTSSER